jgi:OOP family OmpA-OmpF porin
MTTAFASQGDRVPGHWGGKEVYLVKKADNFIILYDRSGSMADIYGQTVMTELQAERKILVEKNATLPDMNWTAGIYSFTPGRGFENLTTFYPMQAYDKVKFSRTISKMPREPKGPTLLQQGLSSLRGILSGLQGRTIVFLFTDSQYTPVAQLPSPGAQARQLAAQFDVCFGIIDTGSKDKGAKTIAEMAAVNDCSFTVPFGELLGNPEWMSNALFTVMEKKSDVMAEAVAAKDAVLAYEWENILFDFDKSDIKPEYHAILADVGTFMRNNPESRVILAGHCDNIGTWDYNIKLSHRRAASVRNYLVEKESIEAGRITLSGFGYDDPVATNDTAEGRALNRRVQGIITAP